MTLHDIVAVKTLPDLGDHTVLDPHIDGVPAQRSHIPQNCHASWPPISR